MQTALDPEGCPYQTKDPPTEPRHRRRRRVRTPHVSPRLGARIVSLEEKLILADGAIWIWKIAEREFPGAIQIVDIYHARAQAILERMRYSTFGRHCAKWNSSRAQHF